MLAAMLAAAFSQAAESLSRQEVFRRELQPLLTKYCFECHAKGVGEGDVHLDRYENVEQMHRARPVWTRVQQKIRNGEMPPADATQPDESDRGRLSGTIERLLGHIDCATEARPGHTTLRRLNRAEYRNTVRDLFDVDYAPAANFPADDVGYGFDNIGDVLSLPPILLEKYLAAAEKIAAQVKLPSPVPAAADDVRQVLKDAATRAFRRPVDDAELERLVQLVESARKESPGNDDEPLRIGFQAILVSPRFLFRIEQAPAADEKVRVLDDYELASRLSYFLWSTMPDAELMQLARQGRLHEESVLPVQVERMLKSPRSQALVENFAGQWLELRKFAEVQISRETFPGFDEELRAAMHKETLLFFERVLREDRSIQELLTADSTFLNERLARHYGISGVEGEQFREVSLKGTQRLGLLTQGSILTVTSNPTRTSPVKRGKWILENILGEPPPPAPPNVPKLDDQTPAAKQASLRQRMEQHRRDPSCASCHRSMDGLGFALENFDAIGSWRAKDGSWDIDASGDLPSGEKFKGASELISTLSGSRRQQFQRCFIEKLLTFSLGRGLEYYDTCAVDRIATALSQQNDRFSTLVREIVSSEPFRKRDAE
jgi:mono/diheme cytochrome c family protein